MVNYLQSFPRTCIGLIFALIPTASAAEEPTVISCGTGKATVFNSYLQQAPYFILELRSPEVHKYYPFLVNNEFFRMRCESGRAGKPMLMVSHICGGSACTDDGYTIIDPNSGKLLLSPSEQSNEGKAVKILGHPIRRFRCIGSTKNSTAISNNDGEYCYASPLKLE